MAKKPPVVKSLWIDWPVPSGGASEKDIAAALAEEYKDHGEWARHYSVVRMTLGTFFLTAAIGIIYERWDHPDIRTTWLAGITLFIGMLLFLHFSRLTYQEMNHQREIVRSYRAALHPPAPVDPKEIPFWKWDSLYICLGTALFYVIVAHLWRTGHPEPPAPPIAAQPAPSRFTVTYSAVHQTNHGREAHTFLIDETTGDLWQMVCAPDGTVAFNHIPRRGNEASAKGTGH